MRAPGYQLSKSVQDRRAKSGLERSNPEKKNGHAVSGGALRKTHGFHGGRAQDRRVKSGLERSNPEMPQVTQLAVARCVKSVVSTVAF